MYQHSGQLRLPLELPKRSSVPHNPIAGALDNAPRVAVYEHNHGFYIETIIA